MRMYGFTEAPMDAQRQFCLLSSGRCVCTERLNFSSPGDCNRTGDCQMYDLLTDLAPQLTSPYGTDVKYAMHRIRLLQHYGVIPYVVFDGGLLPSKMGTETDRHECVTLRPDPTCH